MYHKHAPKTCRNFLELSRRGYYNGTKFHRVIKDFMAQGGDPTGTGRGGESIYGAKFEDEITRELKHTGAGVLSMANAGPNTNGSQFFLTLAPTPWLDGKHTIFGRVSHGMDVLKRLGNVQADRTDSDGVCDAYIASGRQVYHCQMPVGQESLLQQGKAQVLLPHPVKDVTPAPVPSLLHAAAVQSLASAALGGTGGRAASTLLSSVDSLGRTIVSTFSSSSAAATIDSISHSPTVLRLLPIASISPHMAVTPDSLCHLSLSLYGISKVPTWTMLLICFCHLPPPLLFPPISPISPHVAVTPDSHCHLAPSPCGITESGPCCTAISVTGPSTIRVRLTYQVLIVLYVSVYVLIGPCKCLFPPAALLSRGCAALPSPSQDPPPSGSPVFPLPLPHHLPFTPSRSPHQVATSCFFPRSVDLHDPASPSPASPLRTFRLPFPPAAVGFLGGTERGRGGGKRRGGEMEGEGGAVEGVRLLAVCEGPQVCVGGWGVSFVRWGVVGLRSCGFEGAHARVRVVGRVVICMAHTALHMPLPDKFLSPTSDVTMPCHHAMSSCHVTMPCHHAMSSCQLSIWDERSSENGGCIQRITVSPAAEPLYALASTVGSGTGLVAVGGAERTVAVYDVRKWAARGRWVGCVRQDVMGIAFPVAAGGEREEVRRERQEGQQGQEGLSFGSDESVFVWSGDNEVVCGRWTEGEGRVGSVRRAEKGRGKGGSGRGGKGGEWGGIEAGGRGRAQPSREKVNQQNREQQNRVQQNREQPNGIEDVSKEDIGLAHREEDSGVGGVDKGTCGWFLASFENSEKNECTTCSEETVWGTTCSEETVPASLPFSPAFNYSTISSIPTLFPPSSPPLLPSSPPPLPPSSPPPLPPSSPPPFLPHSPPPLLPHFPPPSSPTPLLPSSPTPVLPSSPPPPLLSSSPPLLPSSPPPLLLPSSPPLLPSSPPPPLLPSSPPLLPSSPPPLLLPSSPPLLPSSPLVPVQDFNANLLAGWCMSGSFILADCTY
ncbi:unnamed protein product [Closterium sp. Naga37s-1]|nr:unnamed protein product [Closterium sp. Naga37s-1]